mmetsp:Transcript_5016/g.12895  ORF Transcript_5016/g.12895 Transcript_5016/m.12895 type:complete len:292 (-) Transcript_5016:117-992(-)
MVIVHVGHDRRREGQARVDLRVVVLLHRDTAGAGEAAHEGHVQDLVHAEHREVAEIHPVSTRVLRQVLLPYRVLLVLGHCCHLPSQHHARVSCPAEVLLGHAQACARVFDNVSRVARHAREAEDGAALLVCREADDGADWEAFRLTLLGNGREDREALGLRHEGLDLLWPREALATLLVLADPLLPRSRLGVDLAHALNLMPRAPLWVLLLVLLLELGARHRVPRLSTPGRGGTLPSPRQGRDDRHTRCDLASSRGLWQFGTMPRSSSGLGAWCAHLGAKIATGDEALRPG